MTLRILHSFGVLSVAAISFLSGCTVPPDFMTVSGRPPESWGISVRIPWR
ncbi:hypothetical protein [Lacrimispora sp.]|nr:hypothetical protein [Lacrimispora sp.]